MPCTPKKPSTPEGKKTRVKKLLSMLFDTFMPVLAIALLSLAVLFPQAIFASLAGMAASLVLIRFSTTRCQGETKMQIFDVLALIGGILLLLLSLARLLLLLLHIPLPF